MLRKEQDTFNIVSKIVGEQDEDYYNQKIRKILMNNQFINLKLKADFWNSDY